MKDELPEGWAPALVCAVTEKVPNSNPEDEPRREFGYIDISAVDNSTFSITDVKRFRGIEAPSRARRPVRPNDVLFSNVRTYLRNVAMVETNTPADLCSTGFTVLRPTAAIEPRYLFRYVLTQEFIDRVTPQQTGTHYPATSDRVVMAEAIALAPIDEQRRIVAQIEALLAKVRASEERLDKIPTIIERFRQAVLAAGCSGRLTADWRETHPECSSVQLREELLAARARSPFARQSTPAAPPTDRFDIDAPSTWSPCSLDELSAHITSGSRDWSQFYRENGQSTFVMAQNIRPMKFDTTHRQGVAPPENDRDRVRSEVKVNDLLITIVGANTGDCCRVPLVLQQHYVCQSVALIRPTLSLTSRFIELYLNSPSHGLLQFRDFMYGQGRPHLGFDQIRTTVVFLPPPEEIKEIIRRADQLLTLADRLEGRAKKAQMQVEKLTQSILAKAFRGELVPTEAALARAEGRSYETAEQLLARIRDDDTLSSRTAGKHGRKSRASAGLHTTSSRQPSASSRTRGSTRSSTK